MPRCAFLVDHAGHHVSGDAVELRSARRWRVSSLAPAASVLATFRVPVEAVPGTYHGLVLVEHLADLALPILAEVRPPETDGRR